MKEFRKFALLFWLLFAFHFLVAEDGYDLWLRYERITNEQVTKEYKRYFSQICIKGNSQLIESVKLEFILGLDAMLGIEPAFSNDTGLFELFVAKEGDPAMNALLPENYHKKTGPEGFGILYHKNKILLWAKEDIGLLYGSFHLLRMLQLEKNIEEFEVLENPKLKIRLLNHWDNLDRTVERGYAGFSIWNWHQLPEYRDSRYKAYARANASIGINGAVVTNVNSNSLIFRKDYLEKAAALAEEFRPYGVRLYLTARFSSPIEMGGLSTADPLDGDVIQWWQNKVDEIYELIPDFGGFLVKANSEGQPGPQQYGRDHADGANMLATALKPHGGIVMWRAFVYSDNEEDRAKKAYNEFLPLDNKFLSNVLVQVKNGPIDFQPREPISPLFGAMKKTALMMEFQITKEYLGQGTHLVGLANMYKEVLETDTYVKGKGSTVSEILKGNIHKQKLTGMAGVSNIGTSRNWTSHLFGQCDWYAYGKLAWDPDCSLDEIYSEWIIQTFGKDKQVYAISKSLLLESHQACVDYMTPLGLHHIKAANHHYGPGPWVDEMPRPDWTCVYYHKADSMGIGFDRMEAGSNAISQYEEELQIEYGNIENLDFLLWFHHVPWDKKLHTGKNLWEEMIFRYDRGVAKANNMKAKWEELEGKIDFERYNSVKMHLLIQAKEAKWWRDACISYFQHKSGKEIPAGVEAPENNLEYYKKLNYPYAPGIRPRW